MGRNRNWLQSLAEGADLGGEPLPMQPLVELAGDGRVLIEHHQGVVQYSREKICVKVRYGIVAISGCGLELRHMNRAQLSISGRIDCVALERR